MPYAGGALGGILRSDLRDVLGDVLVNPVAFLPVPSLGVLASAYPGDVEGCEGCIGRFCNMGLSRT